MPGSETVEYGVIGEALQNAWYRFGVGVDDTFAGASLFAECGDWEPGERLARALRLERVMTARSVQILYHLYSVARNTDQGVVGPVLTEYHIDEQHTADLAEARLRDAARHGLEMLSAECDIRAGVPDPLIEAALDHQREECCRRVMALMKSLPYPPDLIARAMQPMKLANPEWRSLAFATLAPALTPAHGKLLPPLFEPAKRRGQPDGTAERLRQERLVELGMGRYSWVTPWLRACALRGADPAAPVQKPL